MAIRFMDLLEEYLDLRESLMDEENNYNSIDDRANARAQMRFRADYISTWIEHLEVRIENIEEGEWSND